MTQHSEAQGVRCKIRECDEYGDAVDEFTAGTATTAGLHQDDTVKYAVNELFKPDQNAAEGILEAHRAEIAAKDARFNSYWETAGKNDIDKQWR